MTNNHEQICSPSFLPELVWELILDRLDNSRDTENVFSAFPELHTCFHQKKTLWLFDQVYPHVFRCLKWYEKHGFISACRQSCKRWCHVSDNFLRNHPTRRPYNKAGLTRRTVPYREFSYDDWIDQGYVVNLRTVESVSSFHDSLTKHHNPGSFLKTVRISIVTDHTDLQGNLDFINAALLLLQTFGQFIWQIDLSIHVYEPEKILQLLSHLPNVRKLFLSLDFCVTSYQTFGWKSKLRNILPLLPCLETLKLHDDTPSFLTRPLIHHLRLQIQKLSIHREHFRDSTIRLNNLVELEILFENINFCDYDEFHPKLKRFPFLKKLILSFTFSFEENLPKMSTSKLFEILKPARLEELRLDNFPIIDDSTSFYQNINMKVSSVKYLFLVDYKDQELNFVTVFPSLEHLEIRWSKEISNGGRQRLETYKSTLKQLDTFTSIVRLYIYQSSDVPASVNIWDKIASLKLLSTTNWNSTFEAKFARECGNKPFYSFDNSPLASTDDSDEEDTSDSDGYYDDEDDLEMSDESYCVVSSGRSEESMAEEADRNNICRCCEIF